MINNRFFSIDSYGVSSSLLYYATCFSATIIAFKELVNCMI